VAARLTACVGRGSLMGGNIIDNPLTHPVVLPRLMAQRVPGRVGVVGTLLGPEGTGPAPHRLAAGWGCLVFTAGRLLSLDGAGTARHTGLTSQCPASCGCLGGVLVAAFGVWVAVGCL